MNINTGQWWLRVLLISVLQLLLVWGSCRLVSNVFGLQEVASSFKFKCLILLCTLAISFWNEWSRNFEQKMQSRIGNVILLLGIAVVVWLAYGRATDELVEGFQMLGNIYIRRWNSGTREYRLGSADAMVLQPVLELLLLAIMSFAQIIGGMVRKYRGVLLVPVSIICAGLLIMALPQWSDLVILIVSGVLLFYFDSCIGVSWKHLTVLLVGVLVLSVVTGSFQEEAEKQVSSMNGDWFNFWENLGEKIEENIDDFEIPDWSIDKDVIDNKPPEFDDKQVILLTMSEMPVRTVYLRGYHCEDYEGGVWTKESKKFEEACETYGISEEEATEKLILYQYEQEDIYDNRQVMYELSYTDIRNEYCYFPYGVGWEETPENFALSQDYLIKKGTNDKDAKVVGWQQLYHLNAGVETTLELSLFQEWYNDYTYENYLSVAENQKVVKRLADEMSEDSRFGEYMVCLNPGRNSANEVNSARLHVAYLVAEWLKSYGTYSLELDKLPMGEDTIEYFLETSKEGFCEHFASAGTLLLRELGVPARYARGYVVKTGIVKSVGDEYTASVLDSYAHAWTEIYLDNYGWVPIEMTPGYSGGSDITTLPETVTTPEPGDLEHFPEEESPDEETTPTEAPENMEMPTEVPPESDEAVEIPEEDFGESEKDSSKGLGSAWSKALLIIIVLCFIACLSFIGYYYVVGNRGRSRKRLAGYMRREENRRAVKWINEAMYHQLVHKEHKYSKIKDDEFLAALKLEFPDVEDARWDAYFEVVRKAAYSADKVTPEEVKECYALYRVVQQREKNRR